MTRFAMVFPLFIFSFATPCLAQEIPEWEFFGGYSFQRSDVREYFKSSPIIYTFRGKYASLSGWDASVTENLTAVTTRRHDYSERRTRSECFRFCTVRDFPTENLRSSFLLTS